MTPEHHEIAAAIHKGRGSDEGFPKATERLTLRLRPESKRKAHALALASNRSIAQVIEELIENCPGSSS
jgi:predicted HicB family RNase H-like nuclease